MGSDCGDAGAAACVCTRAYMRVCLTDNYVANAWGVLIFSARTQPQQQEILFSYRKWKTKRERPTHTHTYRERHRVWHYCAHHTSQLTQEITRAARHPNKKMVQFYSSVFFKLTLRIYFIINIDIPQPIVITTTTTTHQQSQRTPYNYRENSAKTYIFCYILVQIAVNTFFVLCVPAVCAFFLIKPNRTAKLWRFG